MGRFFKMVILTTTGGSPFINQQKHFVHFVFTSEVKPPNHFNWLITSFSDHTPSLRYLRIHRMAFQLPVNWFPQLQSLHLVGQFLPHELLLSFSWKTLPILESLSIHFSEESNFGDSCPEIQFPRLQFLVLGGHLAACLKVLDHITAPEGCGLSLSTFDQYFIPPTSLMSRPLSRFYKYHAPLSILLEVSAASFTFQFNWPSIEPPIFHLRISCGEAFPTSRCFKAILDCPFPRLYI